MDETAFQAPKVVSSPATPPISPSKKPPRWLKIIVIGGAVVLLAFLTGSAIYLIATQKFAQKTTPEVVACPRDAQRCPDGSFVGRILPNCAFAPCPAPTTNPTANLSRDKVLRDWKTYRNEKHEFEIKYPAEQYEPFFDEDILYPFRTKNVWEIATLCFLFLESEGGCYGTISISPQTYTQYINAARAFNAGSYNLIEKDIIFDGQKAKMVYYEAIGSGEIYYQEIYLGRDDKLFILASNFGDEEWEKIESQILSTFKFLPASPAGGD